MFTWICPQCGREVPPAYDQCPDCSGKTAGQAPQPPAQGPSAGAPQAPPSYPPPQQYAPPRQFAPTPQYPPPPQYAPPGAQAPAPPYLMQQQPPGPKVPPWLMSIGFAVLFLAVGAALFFGIKRFSGSGEASASTSAPPESSAAAAPGAAKKNSTLQKYVEVGGLRLTESGGKAEVHFLVINHSGAEMSDLSANVNLWARTAKSDEEAIGTFSFKLSSLGAYESKDMTAPLTTKLRVYELPDWQNLTAEVQITSPQ